MQTVGRLHAADDAGSPFQPAASITPFGKGKLAATYFSFSRGYLSNRSPKARAFLNELVRKLFPSPLVEVEGSADVNVTVNGHRGKLAINLVNSSGPHWDTAKPLMDAIPAIGPLEITIRREKKPAHDTGTGRPTSGL